jgi:HK97 family phage portal protein
MAGLLPMNWITRIFAPKVETRAAPSSWDLLKMNRIDPHDAGFPISATLAENLSAVYGAVQAIAETVAMLSIFVYRKEANGDRQRATEHPLSKLFAGQVNDWMTIFDFVEYLTASCLLRGNGFAEIIRDTRGAVAELVPLHPDHVSVVRLSGRRYAFDVSGPTGGTRRVLAEEMLHLKDRSDDGIVGVSRLARARETFIGAVAAERFARQMFESGAVLSGVLQMNGQVKEEAAERLRTQFKEKMTGTRNLGNVAILEEGAKFTPISVPADDAQLLASREFNTKAIARIFRIPPAMLGDLQGGNYSSTSEMGRWFASFCVQPWLVRWERCMEMALLSETNRATHEIEFDVDTLLRADMLQRFQTWRIAREIGIYSANEIRAFEMANRRQDPGGDEYFAPANLQPEQAGRPIADRGGEAE